MTWLLSEWEHITFDNDFNLVLIKARGKYYTRIGQCKQCGLCCYIKNIPKEIRDSWVKNYPNDGEKCLYLAYNKEGKRICVLHGTGLKGFCMLGPLSPKNIKNCGYKFVELKIHE